MSIHGVQIRFPFSFNKEIKDVLSLEATVAANFIEIQNRIDSEETLISFSQISWPFIFIQAETNQHIMIDDIGLCNFKSKVINSPRTAQVGHVLRDKDRDLKEKLQLVLEIIKFEKTINIDGEEKSKGGELIPKEIKGLVEPKLLDTFSKIIPFTEKFQMSEIESLESLFTFDDALDYAKNYIDLILLTKGNKQQWESLLDLIEEPIEVFLTDIKVKIKDVESLYISKINKEKKLDEGKIQEKLDKAKDFADQWTVRKHKDIIQNIGKLFVGIDLLTTDIKKNNQIFIDTDTLKNEHVGKVLQQGFKHIAYLRSSLSDFSLKLDNASKNLNAIQDKLKKAHTSADEKIDNVSAELLGEKENQEKLIQMLFNEKAMKIEELERKRDNIIELWNQIKDIIENKILDLTYDLSVLKSWQLDDEKTNIQTPTVRYFLPIGIAIIEDEFDDERIEIILPSIIQENLERKYLSRDFKKFEKEIIKILDKNMKIRSNFEFASERGNFVESGLKSTVERGLKELKMHKLIDDESAKKWLEKASL